MLSVTSAHSGYHAYMVGEDPFVLSAISSEVVFRMTQCIAAPSACKHLTAALCMNRGYLFNIHLSNIHGSISMTLLLPERFWMESDITSKKLGLCFCKTIILDRL